MSKIVDLKEYDIVFTTSFECPHGVSGHLYELIDYFYIASINNISCAILLTDTTSKELFASAVKDKYNFTSEEYNLIINNTFETPTPKIVMAKNVCVVDGSWRFGSCVFYTDNMFLLRCSEHEFEKFHNHKTIKRAHVMQDFKLYPERYEHIDVSVVDYVKKILWNKYHYPKEVTTNTALLYLTTNCRALTVQQLSEVIERYDYKQYLVLTNNTSLYETLSSDSVIIKQAPIEDIFENFDAYIYTATPDKEDCSPRFIVECAVFGKEVIYDIDYVCKGVERRKEDIAKDLNSLLLTSDDFFIKYIKEHIYGKQHS
jgi:hypothetical protein